MRRLGWPEDGPVHHQLKGSKARAKPRQTSKGKKIRVADEENDEIKVSVGSSPPAQKRKLSNGQQLAFANAGIGLYPPADACTQPRCE